MRPMSRLSSIQPVVADEYGFGYFEATPCQMPAIAASCWLPDTDSTTRPFHAAMLDWDELVNAVRLTVSNEGIGYGAPPVG